jgi:hypothetical protein
LRQSTHARAHSLVGWLSGRLDLSVHPCGRATGVAEVGVGKHTLAEPEDYLPDVILIRAFLCDVALNDVLCDNRQYFHVLGVNKRQIVFGRLCLLVNGIACPLLLIFFFLWFHSRFQMRWSYLCDSEWGATLGVVKARSNF